MFGATHTIRWTATALALGATMAATVVPAALAGGNSQFGPPDGWYSYAVSITKHQQPTLLDGRSPDTRDAAAAALATSSRFGAPDGWYPYVVSITSQQHPALFDGRSPDTRDAAATASLLAMTPLDGRSPDTADAAFLAHLPTVTVFRSTGFQWGDFSTGVAAALGLVLLLAVSAKLVMARRSGHRTDPVATA
jgi:hypothetical protein